MVGVDGSSPFAPTRFGRSSNPGTNNFVPGFLFLTHLIHSTNSTDGRNGVHPKKLIYRYPLILENAGHPLWYTGKEDRLATQHHYPICKPPFTENSAPVANADSSEATQDTIEAISDGVPKRFTGMPAMILSSTSWRTALTMSVPI
jgi:hypothetical protein